MKPMISLEEIREAQKALQGIAEVTPMVTSRQLGANLIIKSKSWGQVR